MEYRDEEVNFILIDEGLTNQQKLLSIKNHYKKRLLSSGKDPQAIKFTGKDIREEILYEQKRIETAFRNLTFSYNEANVNMAMGKIHLMQDALDSALAEIVTNISEISIPIRDQHEIHEAKKLGREVDEVKAIHADQLAEAQTFYSEAQTWGMLLWGAFIAILIGTYVYMYSPVIMQMIHGIGQSGTEEAKRTEKIVSGIATIVGVLGWIAGIGILFHAGIRAFFYPIALIGFVIEWISIRAGLLKTQSYNGEAKKQAFRALLWAVSPSILLLGLAGYYIFQPFSGRSQTTGVTTQPPSPFQPNALTNRSEPIRDANNATANTVETLAINTPIFILHPEQKRRWFEVQAQSGKTGWIDGNGFRLANSSEIASYSGEINTNPNWNGTPPSGVDTNSNMSSNSSDVATATPLPNPFIDIPSTPTPIPPPPPTPTPRPIENPDMVFRQTKNDFINGLMGALDKYSIYSNRSVTFEETTSLTAPVESPLKNIINNGDEELVQKVKTLLSSFHESIRTEISMRQLESELKFRLKYPNENFEFRNTPEKSEFLSSSEQYTRRKLNQLVQMLNDISNSSQRNSKLGLIEQDKNQVSKENEASKKKYEEIRMSWKEANLPLY